MRKLGTVTFVLGLAGSGKTHLIQWMKHDWMVEEDFFTPTWFDIKHAELVKHLQNGNNCVVSELQLLTESVRDAYVARLTYDVGDPTPSINWICFENNLEVANHNCRRRTNKPSGRGSPEQHVQQNNAFAPAYTIPNGAIVMKIHRL